MSIIYVLIPLGLVLVGIGLWAFFWAVGNGQFDDLDSPGWSVLADDEAEKTVPADRDPAGTTGSDDGVRS
jgi:cbb3-type cytochrome oxidase maturation protein